MFNLPKMKKCFLIVCFALALIGILSANAQQCRAADVTLAWDANDPVPDGYLIYMRVDGGTYNYDSPAWPKDGQKHTETTCTISGLEEGKTYHFVARAFKGDVKSGDSNEADYAVPVSAPDAPSNLRTLIEQAIKNQEKMLSNQDLLLANFGLPKVIPPNTEYCGNPTSKKFHRSEKWCGVNAVRFGTRQEAIEEGYVPCKICKP